MSFISKFIYATMTGVLLALAGVVCFVLVAHMSFATTLNIMVIGFFITLATLFFKA